MAFITGSSNYPIDFDLSPSGTGTAATLFYVLDEIRDSNGVVTQSGNTVIARDVNVAYTVINQLERTLGLGVEGYYPDVSARLNFMENSGNLAFVHITGDSMLGVLTFPSGASRLIVTNLTSSGLNWVMSGNSSIVSNGDVSIGASGNLNVDVSNVNITGSSVILNVNSLVVNGLTQVSNDIVPGVGVVNLGSTGSFFDTLYVDTIVSTGSSSLPYVHESGNSMFGNLNFTGSAGITLDSGSNISNLISGVNQLGDVANPFGGVYTKYLFATNISGLSPITFLSDLEFASGTNIAASGSGITIGSASNPISVLYAQTLVGPSGFDIGAMVAKSGSDIFGNITFSGNANLVMNSGSNIETNMSGVGNIGTSGTPFANVYANTINNRTPASFGFNEILSGTADGINKTFTFANAPSSNYAMVFVSGMLIAPTTQYIISGTSLFLTGSMYAPTTAPVAGFYIF